MIISGYQGVGKSTLCYNIYKGYIDLESSLFFVDGKRDDNWYKVYVQQAVHFSDEGYIVFISSHGIVRDYLDKIKEEYFTLFPSVKLKSEWVEKLEARYISNKTDKNYKAWKNAEAMYAENVQDLSQHANTIEITSMDYNLEKLIKDKRNRTEVKI